MTSRGLTVAGVARDTGIPRQTLDRSLQGHRALNVDELDAIAPVVGHASVADLMTSVERAA